MKNKTAKLNIIYFLLVGTLLVLTGCAGLNGKSTSPSQAQKLRKEVKNLKKELETLQAENKSLQGQLQVLQNLPKDVKLENLCRPGQIKVTRYTGFYDKDKDGKRESLIVYIKPYDENGDLIKASGAVDIQLWDLNRKDGSALLGQWHIKPEELKKLWFSSVMSTGYRLTFNVKEHVESFKQPFTVKVTFTDYLTGEVFKEQRVIKPR